EDSADQAPGAPQARARAVEAGDGATEADAFPDHEGDVDERARRHGGDQRDAARRGGREGAGTGIERRDQGALGEFEELAAVEELLLVGVKTAERAGEIGAAGIDA